MTISNGKERIVAYVDSGVVVQMDKVASELGISRSVMVGACIESGMDDLRFLGFLGLTPRRLAGLGKVIKRLNKLMAKGSARVEGC